MKFTRLALFFESIFSSQAQLPGELGLAELGQIARVKGELCFFGILRTKEQCGLVVTE